MFTKTSISAMRALTWLGSQDSGQPQPPRAIAAALGESPSYLAKVMQSLVRAGIVRAQRGVRGGVTLARPPREVTLLAIVEACQGKILGSFCQDADDLSKTCGFHHAAAELHQAVVGTMSRWTLQHFLDRPRPDASIRKHVCCWLDPATRPGSEIAGRPALSRARRAANARPRRPARRAVR